MALNQKLTKIYFSGLQPSLSSSISSSFYLSGVGINSTSSSIINSTTTVLSVSSLLYTVPSGRIAKVMITGGVSLAADMYLSLLVAGASFGTSLSNASQAWGASITGVMQGAAQLTIGAASAGISSSIPVTVSVSTFSYVINSLTARCAFGHAGMNFQHAFLSNGSMIFSQSTQSAILGPYASSSTAIPMDSVNAVWLNGGPRLSGGGVAVSTSVNPSSYNSFIWGSLSYSGANSTTPSVLTAAQFSSISAWQQSLTGASATSYSAATFYLLSGESIAINYALSATVSGTFSGGSALITSSFSVGPSADSYTYYPGYNGTTSYSARQSVGLLYTLTASGGPAPGVFGAGLQFLVIEETTA
jgi:hypothetical protein